MFPYFLHFFPSSNTHHVSIKMLAGQIIKELLPFNLLYCHRALFAISKHSTRIFHVLYNSLHDALIPSVLLNALL